MIPVILQEAGIAGFEQSVIKPLFGELPMNCTFSKEWNI